jgi:arylsulfatase A-like enzyme/Flp pilus assembly protein TadD
LGCYGNKGIQTPNIDALAKEGVLFENAYSVQPVTLPSHSSIHTGKYPFRHGVRDNNIYKLGDEHVTLAEVMAQQGYLTCAFVGSYILDHKFGLSQGFHFYNDKFIKPKQKGRLPVDRRASEVTMLATEWLEATKGELKARPFFLWLHYYDPHADYAPPEPYRSAYPDPYNGEIAYTDDWLGYFFDELRKRDLWKDTLVVLVADHGESLGEHDEQTHGMFIYSATTHVPMIIRYSGKLPAGARVEERVSQVDILPTVLGLLGFPIPEGVDGIPLLSLMTRGRADPNRPVYSEVFIPRGFGWSDLKGVRRNDWFYVSAPTPELYQQESEGKALKSLLDSHAAKAEEMSGVLHELLKKAGEAKSTKTEVSDEMAARLRALGYFVGAEERDEGAEPRQRPDPKEKIDLFNLYQRASSLTAAGATAQGTALLRQLVEADPESNRFEMELAQTLIEQGEIAEAEIHLGNIIERTPEDARAHFMLGLCYLGWGKPGPALKKLVEVTKIDPNHFQAHFQIGVLRIGQKQWKEAKAALGKALELKPNEPNTLNNLGYIAIKGEGDIEAGIALIEKALKAAPENPSVMTSLGSAYATAKQYDKAKAHLEAALEKVPDHLGIIQELMKVYRAMGDKAGVNRLKERMAAMRGPS